MYIYLFRVIINCLFGLFGGHAGLAVDDADVHLVGTLNESAASAGGQVGRKLSLVDAVVHEEALEVRRAANEELEESGLVHVTSLLVATVTDVRLGHHTTEAATEGTIDTLLLAP